MRAGLLRAIWDTALRGLGGTGGETFGGGLVGTGGGVFTFVVVFNFPRLSSPATSSADTADLCEHLPLVSAYSLQPDC